MHTQTGFSTDNSYSVAKHRQESKTRNETMHSEKSCRVNTEQGNTVGQQINDRMWGIDKTETKTKAHGLKILIKSTWSNPKQKHMTQNKEQ